MDQTTEIIISFILSVDVYPVTVLIYMHSCRHIDAFDQADRISAAACVFFRDEDHIEFRTVSERFTDPGVGDYERCKMIIHAPDTCITGFSLEFEIVETIHRVRTQNIRND